MLEHQRFNKIHEECARLKFRIFYGDKSHLQTMFVCNKMINLYITMTMQKRTNNSEYIHE